MKTSFFQELDKKKEYIEMATLGFIKDNGPKENRMEKDCFMKSEVKV